MFLGCHLSTTKGFLAMGLEAQRLGADTFQFFTRNPRGGAVKALDLKDLKALVAFISQNGFGPVVAHAPYTLNPCSAEAKTRQFAHLVMSEDLERLRQFPGAYYNFHPGSHTGQGTKIGISLIAELLNDVLTEDETTIVLLETMAGKGSEIGRTFDELAEIIGQAKLPQKLGVCLDTCHVFDGGYDLKSDIDGVLLEFDQKIGLTRLKAVHINDSLNSLGSHKDRHAKIGEGQIGLEALKRVLFHEKLQALPFILETPNELEGYALEIKLLKGLIEPTL
jgi:deoxyribonuclease-4